MRLVLPMIAVLAWCGTFGAKPASAAPITWGAMGTIGQIFQGSGVLSPPLPGFVVAGLPWTLTFTFDPEAPGTHLSHCGANPTFWHPGAIGDTHLQLGDFSYTYAGAGDIFTNADLPVFGCGDGGIVQFQWNTNQWLGSPAAPTLTGLLIASYFDSQACDGSLPAVPNQPAPACAGGFLALAGLNFHTLPFSGGGFTAPFDPQVVPEPGTWMLIGSGLAAMMARRRRARRRP